MLRSAASRWLPVLLFLSLCYVYLPESIDDAYITLRHSRNLLAGHGPVFNVGERVEGYSSFVWMALLALAGKLGLSMPAAMKAGGIASGVATIVVAGRTARAWLASELAVFSVRLLLAVSSFFAVWSADGLETSFYTLLLVLLVWRTASAAANAWWIGVLAGLAALTRPEGILFGMIALACVALTRSLADAARAAAPLLVLALGYEIFRLIYFHEWVANTALAKVHVGPVAAAAGLRYFRAFSEHSGYLLAPAAVVGATVHVRHPGLALASAFVGAQLVFLVVSGGDFMLGYRFVVPVIPCLVLLAVAAAMALREHSAPAAAALVAALAVSTGACQFASLPAKHISTDNLWYRASPLFDIARFVERSTTPTDTVLLSEAGIVPFGTRARIEDYLGLTSPFWYVRKPDRSLDVAHVLARAPRLVILSFVVDAAGAVIPRLQEDRDLFASPAFRARYRPLRRFDIPRSGSFLNAIYYVYAPTASVIYFEVFARNDGA